LLYLFHPHYSTISRRINRLEIKINEKLGNDIVIALDSTGIKVAKRGEWMQHKWNVRKGYLKIHIAVDIKKKRILSLEVTSEEVHDGKVLKKLVDSASENNNLKGIFTDGMYESNKNFRYLSKNHNKPGIRTRSNSKVRSTNCHARNMSAVRQQANLKRWKRSVSNGYRWIAEIVFSSIKRTFGEHVTARKFPHMVKEMFVKAALYNMFNRITYLAVYIN
jgi:IS5 family transposase